MKIIIVGGGVSGWMTAAHLSTFNQDVDITVIESPRIPGIQVGESVTPHVSAFFNDLNIPTHEWMKGTGAVYKLGNKFVNWSHGKGEEEYFSFTFTNPIDNYLKDIYQPQDLMDFRPRKHNSGERSIDHVGEMLRQGTIDKYDQYAHSQYHYMCKNVAPFNGNTKLLNQPWSLTHHINAELTGKFLRDTVALPNGVNHILSEVVDLKYVDDTIQELILENGEIVTGDLFVDATGFHRRLINALGWEKVHYDYPIDSAWVCQTEYVNQDKEMLNYTNSIAEPAGWRFDIGLYHRMGNGYCFSSKYVSDEDALAHLKKQLTNPIKLGPKLIKWKPSRLKDFARGNVISIGLSSGFIEPMEANLLYITIFSIRSLSNIIKRGTINWDKLNQEMTWSFDDVYDFLLAHYTLTNRDDTPFWKDMKEWGQRHGHIQKAIDKTNAVKNSVFNSLAGKNLFPDYMWQQLVSAWGHSPERELDPKLHELAKHSVISSEKKHDIITNMLENNYQWHKTAVYDNLICEDWAKKYIKTGKTND